MRRLIRLGACVLLLASVAGAQDDVKSARYQDAISHGEFAQLALKIVGGYGETTPGPETALEKVQRWGLMPTTWLSDDGMTHGELAQVMGQIGVSYLPAHPDEPVSGVFVEAFLWREVTKLRDYYAKRLGHGFSANHILDAGVDRAVSPSDFD